MVRAFAAALFPFLSFSLFFLARGSNGAINRLKVLCLNKFNIIRGVKKYNVSRKEHRHNIISRVSQRTAVARVTQILLTCHYRCVPENKNNEISVTARVPDTTCNTCELSCGKAKKKKKHGWRQLVICVCTTVGEIGEVEVRVKRILSYSFVERTRYYYTQTVWLRFHNRAVV